MVNLSKIFASSLIFYRMTILTLALSGCLTQKDASPEDLILDQQHKGQDEANSLFNEATQETKEFTNTLETSFDTFAAEIKLIFNDDQSEPGEPKPKPEVGGASLLDQVSEGVSQRDPQDISQDLRSEELSPYFSELYPGLRLMASSGPKGAVSLSPGILLALVCGFGLKQTLKVLKGETGDKETLAILLKLNENESKTSSPKARKGNGKPYTLNQLDQKDSLLLTELEKLEKELVALRKKFKI